MALGILEPSSGNGFPAGTVLLKANGGHHHGPVEHVSETPISPHDPLNLSKVRKNLYFMALLYGACVAGAVGPLLIPGFSIIAVEFQVSLTNVTLLNGALIMTLGISAYLCAPLSDICGRRLVYLVTSILGLVGCLWASYAKTYGSLLASRAIQGLGLGGFMSLAGTASINDVFLVHERGRRVGLWNFAVLLACNLTPVISGYTITQLGWSRSFQLMAAAFGVALLLTLFFIPETIFERGMLRGVPRQDSLGDKCSNDNGTETPETKSALATTDDPGQQQSEMSSVINDLSPNRTRFLGLHAIQVGKFKELPTMLASPVLALRHPIVVWAAIMWSVFFTWVIIQGAVADQIYRAPPYNLSPQSVGILIGVPPLIGSALGTILGGWLSDLSAKVLANRNSGIYEPEFRLLLIIPAVTFIAIGGYGLGAVISAGSSVWASAILLGVLNFGVGVGCTSIVAYSNDAISHLAAESMGIAMLIKSCFAFGLTFVLNDYYANRGAMVFFSTWASLSLGITLLTVLIFVFGKRIRSSFS
ncbi:major facilitator superfamily domain-containing protein [Stachybotrys elegans]|uniref:Major facilitator superfamily domain-containing protein n=1 Tax=Stachybotrys elegans TaxID=80388 RepID=A0A8K0WZ81_9HYPO|nr:major facilitator superfamily domain-containing protein [Stachybotrys elegans]